MILIQCYNLVSLTEAKIIWFIYQNDIFCVVKNHLYNKIKKLPRELESGKKDYSCCWLFSPFDITCVDSFRNGSHAIPLLWYFALPGQFT